MLEFALLAPVIAALLAGFAGVSMTFVRTMQADQLCRKVAQMAASGVDFDQDAIKDQIYELYGGKALRDRQGVLYVTHVVRESAGYRTAQSFELGKRARWRSSLADSPESVIQLEPGEDAWVAEVWFDNDSILSSVTPKELHARVVQ